MHRYYAVHDTAWLCTTWYILTAQEPYERESATVGPESVKMLKKQSPGQSNAKKLIFLSPNKA